MSELRKMIVLTPEQLQRLRGREHQLANQFDAERKQVLDNVVRNMDKIGPTQAYAQYQAVQQKHLHHANKDRTEPLEMSMASAPAAVLSTSDEEPVKKEKTKEKIKKRAKKPTKTPVWDRRPKQGRVEKRAKRSEPVFVSPLKTRSGRVRNYIPIGERPWLRYPLK